MSRASSYRQIGIVGTGRVASAIGLALAGHSKAPLRVWGRDPERCAAAIASIGRACPAPRLADIAERCDLVVLAISDDALEQSVAALAAIDGAASPFAFHVSGRSGAAILAPLETRGWRTAAIHPAMTFTGDPQADAALVQAEPVVPHDTQSRGSNVLELRDWRERQNPPDDRGH